MQRCSRFLILLISALKFHFQLQPDPPCRSDPVRKTNLRPCSPRCEAPVSPLFLLFISRLLPLQACLSFSILSELLESTSPDNCSVLLSNNIKDHRVLWLVLTPVTPAELKHAAIVLRNADPTGAAPFKASGLALTEARRRPQGVGVFWPSLLWSWKPVKVSVSETIGPREADLYTSCSGGALQRARLWAVSRGGGWGACEHHSNVFNLGSLWDWERRNKGGSLRGSWTGNKTENHRESERQTKKRAREASWEGEEGHWMSLPCCKCFIEPRWIEGYVFLRLSYGECEQSATPQPHVTQLTVRMGGGQRPDWWAGRSASLLQLITLVWDLHVWTHSFGLSLIETSQWRCVLVMSRPQDLVNTT